MHPWLRWFPGLRSLAGYRREWLSADALAGVALAALIVPAGMAYAELAGLPPISGLYASLAGLVAYAVFGPSRSLVLGPDSATAPLVAAAIIPIAAADPAKRLALGAMLALMVGVISLAVGVFRLGVVTDLLSRPVRVGYLNGIALVVFVSQLPKLFGFKSAGDAFFARVGGFFAGLGHVNWVSFALGASTLAIIMLGRWLWPKGPGLLAAVVAATAVTYWFNLTRLGVATVGAMPQGLPRLAWPAVSFADVSAMLAGAFGVAVLTLTDTTVLSRVFAARFDYDAEPDEEFIAIGAANLATGLFQGFPISGSQTRTAVAVSAGVKSQLAGLVAAFILVVALLFTPGLTTYLPQSALAAVVIVASFALADVAGVARLWRWRRTEFALAIASFLGVVVLGVLPGVFLAVVLSLLNFVRRQWRPHDAVLGRAPGVPGFHDIGDFTDAVEVPGLLIFRFDAPLFFANAEAFRLRVLQLVDEARPPLTRVLIAAEPITDVDTSAVDSVCGLMRDLRKRGVELAFAELKQPVREHMERYGLIDAIGEENLFPTVTTAVDVYIRDHHVDWTDPESGNALCEEAPEATID